MKDPPPNIALYVGHRRQTSGKKKKERGGETYCITATDNNHPVRLIWLNINTRDSFASVL
jgi:hypothetical protein